ncbi:MAG: Hint domain-containing protein [Acetobacteraceae bacterium]|nr:Hint domain-containing protein [Acetobacteraceae bacterium]
MATFTWTATGTGGTTAWETTAAWFDTAGAANPIASSFTTAPGNDYLINGSNLFTINQIGAGGTASPDFANSLTLSDVQGTLLLADGGGALQVATTLSLNNLLNLGTAVGGGVLIMGIAGGPGGTIILGPNGKLEGALNDIIRNAGTSVSTIIGSGTVIAQGGLFEIGQGVQIGAGDTTKFTIFPNATLKFDDAVNGGTIIFTANSGTGILDVVDLSTFHAPIKSMSFGTGANKITSSIDLLNVGTTTSATLVQSGTTAATINVFTNGQTQTLSLLGNFTGKHVNFLSDGAGGANIFLTDTPCYAAGTAILTPAGEAAVETIQPGDIVMTLADGCLVPRRVKWAGVRAIHLASHPKPDAVAPIRFLRGALGLDLPRRDLLLSPDHCLFLDGGLVPAKLLLNGMTIVRDLSLPSVSYHHLELDRHGVLVAEGVAAESYLDTGNRAYFSNAGLATILHPEFGINEHLRCWETDACATLTTRPEAVKPIWDRFVRRAVEQGLAAAIPATTLDAELALMVDGRRVSPLSSEGQTVTFLVPEGAASMRLVSRSVIPGLLKPWLDDPRSLGVAIRSVVLRDRTGHSVMPADHPALTDGWHAPETAPDGAVWRWSGGDAALPIASDGPCVVEIVVSETTTYLESPHRQAA